MRAFPTRKLGRTIVQSSSALLDQATRDPDLAVAQLIGPLAFRHMITHEPVNDAICRQIVADFIRAHLPDGAEASARQP